MSCTLLFVTLAFIVITSVSGLFVPRSTAPIDWASNLEPYSDYHQRYTTFKCYEKHNTQFFDKCCHPLLASESPNKALPSLCARPALASSSSTDLKPTSTDNSRGNDCEEAGDSPSTTHRQGSVATTISSSSYVTPSRVPGKSKAAITSTSDGSNSTHIHEVSAFTSMKKHGKISNSVKTSSQAVTGGFATYYYQNGNAGACGAYHSDGDLIGAIDANRYGYTGKRSSLCGRKVKIVNPSNGHSVVITIADACPTCRNSNSIDLSVAAFKHLSALSVGIVNIDWWFV